MASSSDSDSGANLPLIGEHYQLIEKLGEGAFGEVYKAQHDLLGQNFAVKLLKPELSEDRDVQDRFLDEARALIRFSHPNVVQMRHVGRHEGRLFLVMDYIEGRELAALMKEGAFEEKRALGIMKQILAGLEAAHAAGIVHRDFKSSNVLILPPSFPYGGVPVSTTEHFSQLLHSQIIIRLLPREIDGIVRPLPDSLGRPQ